MIGNLHLGGAETVVKDLSQELRKRGVDVYICSREGGRFEKELREVPCEIISKKDKNIFHYIRALMKLVKREKINIIHSHLFVNNFYGFITAKLTRCKIIMTIHGMDCLRSRKRRFAYRFLARFGDRIIAVSDFLKDEFCKVIKGKKVLTVYNGIDIKKFDNNNRSSSKKRELNLLSAFPLIGAVGNIKPVKGYDLLIKAAQKIFSIYKDGKLLILGDAIRPKDIQYREELQELIKELNLESYIIFLGLRGDVAEILSILDIYLLPSRSEGTSIALLEAMASGRPIIASDVGGNPKLIKDGVNGFLVPPGNWQTLAEKVIFLLEDKCMARKLGEMAKKSVLENFSISRMVSDYMRIYEDLLRGEIS